MRSLEPTKELKHTHKIPFPPTPPFFFFDFLIFFFLSIDLFLFDKKEKISFQRRSKKFFSVPLFPFPFPFTKKSVQYFDCFSQRWGGKGKREQTQKKRRELKKKTKNATEKKKDNNIL